MGASRPSSSHPMPNMDNPEAADSFPKNSAGTQIEETLLTTKAAAAKSAAAKSVLPKSVIPTPSRLGFLGLGIMGQGMVMNLLRSGHEVTVWNRTALKVSDFCYYT